MRRIDGPLAIMVSGQSGPGQKHAFDDVQAHMGCPHCRIEQRLLASASIRLASTATPSPPTCPAWMQSDTIRSDSSRRILLSRNPSLRARENAEWSGTFSSMSSPQNQREPCCSLFLSHCSERDAVGATPQGIRVGSDRNCCPPRLDRPSPSWPLIPIACELPRGAQAEVYQ